MQYDIYIAHARQQKKTAAFREYIISGMIGAINRTRLTIWIVKFKIKAILKNSIGFDIRFALFYASPLEYELEDAPNLRASMGSTNRTKL